MKKILLIASLLCCSLVHAFIPPVTSLLKEATDGRKGGPVELVLRHRISVRGSGTIEMEERIFDEKNRTYFIFSGAPFPQAVGATLSEGTYKTSEHSFQAKSLALVGYLTAGGPDELRDVLIRDQLIRRDHLLQFKPGFTPEGDPATWAIRENYLIHPDIFLRRLETGVAIAIMGLSEGSDRRTVLFDRGLKGIRKFEWLEGETIQSWNCEGFTPFAGVGNYPRRLYYEFNGSEVIQSDVLAVRALNPRSTGEFKNTFRNAERASLSNNGEGILRLLLSYR